MNLITNKSIPFPFWSNIPGNSLKSFQTKLKSWKQIYSMKPLLFFQCQYYLFWPQCVVCFIRCGVWELWEVFFCRRKKSLVFNSRGLGACWGLEMSTRVGAASVLVSVSGGHWSRVPAFASDVSRPDPSAARVRATKSVAAAVVPGVPSVRSSWTTRRRSSAHSRRMHHADTHTTKTKRHCSAFTPRDRLTLPPPPWRHKSQFYLHLSVLATHSWAAAPACAERRIKFNIRCDWQNKSHLELCFEINIVDNT